MEVHAGKWSSGHYERPKTSLTVYKDQEVYLTWIDMNLMSGGRHEDGLQDLLQTQGTMVLSPQLCFCLWQTLIYYFKDLMECVSKAKGNQTLAPLIRAQREAMMY